MCHAFIEDQELLSPRVDVLNFSEDSKDSKDKQLVHNLHVLSEEKEENVVKEWMWTKMMLIIVYKI